MDSKTSGSRRRRKRRPRRGDQSRIGAILFLESSAGLAPRENRCHPLLETWNRQQIAHSALVVSSMPLENSLRRDMGAFVATTGSVVRADCGRVAEPYNDPAGAARGLAGFPAG